MLIGWQVEADREVFLYLDPWCVTNMCQGCNRQQYTFCIDRLGSITWSSNSGMN